MQCFSFFESLKLTLNGNSQHGMLANHNIIMGS